MRTFSFILLLGALAVAGCNTTGSTMSTKVVLNGRTLKVDTWGSLNPECVSTGSTSIRVLEQPRNGRIEIKEAMDFSTYPKDNIRAHCNAKRTPATQVLYTPSPGYKGPDTFQVEGIFPNGSTRITRYSLDVR
ncbi:hypothetical protein JKG68_19080 [Microvirga aerilata]|jgi:hypothetical protein|uniref:Lipoprotein n=1 Tax=Microvirga aerilata TaxID=670292 RepID=A0A936Z8A2_9HYPH|nr:hypothetical protein [Microvirga aerilata]MBL0406068.1 hypothetical protein [Microvirga aerilata]